MAAGRNLQVNALYHMSTEKYTMQRSACTSLHAILSQQNCSVAFCLIATRTRSLKRHKALDSRANDMLMRAECSCHLVVGFLVRSERSVLVDSQGVEAISSPPPHPHPLVNSSCCGMLEWTESLDRLIHQCPPQKMRRDPLRLCFHCHYFALLPPLHPPFPKSCRGDRS